MIDLEKEREAFESCVNTGATTYLHSVDSYEGVTKWVGENPVIRVVSGWDAWKKCAVSKQLEIESLKAQLAQYQSDDWISVNDRLPEDGQDVVATTSIVSCQFVDNEFLEEFYEYDTGHSYQEATHVTHWKPMSQVIKQEKKDV